MRPDVPSPLPHVVGGLLGFTAGFADTAGYLGLDGLFTAHVTGNLVVLGARLAREQVDGAVLRVGLIPLFGVSVALSFAFVQHSRKLGRSPTAALLLAQSTFLGAAALAGWVLRQELAQHTASAVATVGVLAVLGMGIQNALMRLVYGGRAQTTVMTGNVTQIVVDLTRLLSRRRDDPADAEERTDAIGRLRGIGAATSGFVIGAAAGAALTHGVGLASLALPAFVIFGLAARERRGAAPIPFK